MDYIWKPKPDSGLIGSVSLEVPKLKDQFKIIRDMSIKPKDGGLELSQQLDVVEQQVEMSAKYIKSIKLEHEETGTKINSLDELLYWKETRDLVLGEISNIIINGPSLGKLSSIKSKSKQDTLSVVQV